MRSRSIFSLCVFSFTILLACTTVKRHKSIESVTDITNQQDQKVTMSLFGTKIDAAKEDDPSKSLWDLQAEGQAELLKILDKRNTENDKFLSTLGSKYLKAKEKTITDYTAKDLKLIFSIAKKRDYSSLANTQPSFTLGDRIEYLKFSVTIPDNINLTFLKWNKFTTEYATVDIADVSFSKSFEVSGSLGQSSSVTNEKADAEEGTKQTNVGTLTPSVSGKGTFSRTEAQKVRYRYVQLNGSITDKTISIEEEGMREIDLSGNVIADINMKFDETTQTLFQLSGYKSDAGAFQTPDKLKSNRVEVLVPSLAGLPDAIVATLTYEYAYRHVLDKSETFYEWDDKVQYITSKVVQSITIFKQKDVVPAFFQIAKIGEDGPAFPNKTRLVLFEPSTGASYELAFGSKAAADEFWEWLLKFQWTPAKANDPIVIDQYRLQLRQGGTDTDITKARLTSFKDIMQPLPFYR